MNKKQQLFFLQCICHIALVSAVFTFGLLEWATAIFIYFLTGCLGVTVLLHRYYSHKTFEFKYPWMKKFFVACSVWGVIGDPIAWVNTHRHHHRHTDKENDPHSPKVLGFIQVQWFSMFHTPNNLRLVPDLIRDKFLVDVHKYYFVFHWTVLILLLLVNVKLAMMIYLVPAAILWNMGSFINNFGHRLGYRNHDTKDSSVNNPVLGYLVWGEGWHNNHHNSPGSGNFGENSWEFDMGHKVIQVIKQ